ncbi:helix-turn-helix protein [Streptomyces sp. 846.5]|nr:helix-turn-helix domain-containing protein [Streptomyces sp. 846.5]TDU06562.1 helix-turn-helix protein [Streptomyces sp. 846.5]
MDGEGTAVPGVRVVDDTDTLKALADPLRVTILRVMMDRAAQHLRGWTAKELAAELGEPQTKLYRHLKQLEERGLLRVAETRVVSGITEQRYVAGQTTLEFSRDFLDQRADRDDQAEAFGAAIDSFRRQYLAAARGGRIGPASTETLRRPLMMLGDVRISPGRAARFRDRLSALIAEYLDEEDTADGVPLNVLIAVYSENAVPSENAAAAEVGEAETRQRDAG